jgi:hypothetical protein
MQGKLHAILDLARIFPAEAADGNLDRVRRRFEMAGGY